MSPQLIKALGQLAQGGITPESMNTTVEQIATASAGSTWQCEKDGKTMTLTKNENPSPDQESYDVSWE